MNFSILGLFVILVAITISTALISAASTFGPFPSSQPAEPIVGILSQPNRHSWSNLCGQYVQQTYVDWFASVGVRAVPIPYDIPADELQTLLGHLNGALFTGGGLDFKTETTFYNTAKAVYDYAISTSEKNDPSGKFVLWGTCQGFQLISVIAANDFDILHCDFVGTENSLLPLDFTPFTAQNKSRFFKGLSNGDFANPKMTEYFTKYNSTGNAHHCGISPSAFDTTNKNLVSNFDVLSTNVDTSGKPFVSMYEHKTAEIYGSQWHPEGQTFWYISDWPKTPAAIETSHFAGFFLADRLRTQNKHSFPDVTINTDSDNAAATNTYLSTFLKQYPIVENPETQYSGFYCVGDYPGTAQVQSLQQQVQDYRSSRDTFIVLFSLVLIVTIFGWIIVAMKYKKLRREGVLYGSAGGNTSIA